MKARIKATGKIVEVKSKVITSPVTGKSLLKYVNQKTGISYFEEELFFLKDLVDDLDYWTRLEHTYAGMAMQGFCANYDAFTKVNDGTCTNAEMICENARIIAQALVEKMKEERK